MRTMVAGFVVAFGLLAQVALSADAPAAKQAPTNATQNTTAGWYYIPGGWYMLVPAGPNAPSAAAAVPGAVAMPAGLPAMAAPTIIYTAPSNVAPSGWQHGDQNTSDWSWDHGG